MTDINRYSLEDSAAPQLPEHNSSAQPPNMDISPTPSKSIQRSKTVRNLNSAGNKMKGFFKSKNNKESSNNSDKQTNSKEVVTTDQNGFMTRPILSSSASYGPGSEHGYHPAYSHPPPPPHPPLQGKISLLLHSSFINLYIFLGLLKFTLIWSDFLILYLFFTFLFSHHHHLHLFTHSRFEIENVNMYAEQNMTEADVAKLKQLHAQQQQQTQAQQQQAQQQAQQPPPLPQQQVQPQQPQQQPPSSQTPQPTSATSSDEELQAQHHLQQQQQHLQQQQAQQQQHLNFQHELEQLNELIAQRKAEIKNEKMMKERLQNELMEAQRVFKEREAEYSSIEHNFFEHTRAIRATDDDLSTIRDSFKLLKYSIARLIMTLNKKADKAKAAQKFVATWPQLSIVDPATGEMEPSFVNLLSEKLVHEHLVKHVFSAPIYPGLKVNDAYYALNKWLQAHSSQFSIRLRQQMAAVVAKSGKDSEIHQAAQLEKQKIATKIYDDLAEIYHPFLRENDAAVDEDKRYYSKICDIVDKSLKLTIAIRGQEVEIKTVGIEEGKQEFEEETMTEVKGRTSGLVRFCICPSFMGGDREHGFLEKGKVVVVSTTATSTATTATTNTTSTTTTTTSA